MKIDLNSHFPHPVLREENDDFTTGSFALKISEVREATDGNVELDFLVSLDSPDIQGLIDEGAACAGAFIRCQDTFYSGLHKACENRGTWKFERGALYGTVEVKPAIWLTSPLQDWSAASLNAEFGETISIREAEVIGLADDLVFSIGQDKLRRFESIFELVSSDAIKDGRLEVDLMSNSIRILVSSDMFQSIQQLRGTGGGKPILLSAVYLPVVMEVLDSMREKGSTGQEDHRWHQVFSAKCVHLGINVEGAPLLESAQRLLGLPVATLSKAVEEMMNHG